MLQEIKLFTVHTFCEKCQPFLGYFLMDLLDKDKKILELEGKLECLEYGLSCAQ